MFDQFEIVLYIALFIFWGLLNTPRTATPEPEAAPVDYFPEVEPEEAPELALSPESPLIVDEVAETELAPQKPTKTAPKTDETGLTALSIRQLKKLASKHKIRGYGSLTKNELLQALAA